MKALTFQAPNELAYVEVNEPQLTDPKDVIVQVTDCGVCGSELHIIQGREQGMDAGTVIGHEFVGEVVQCGSAVTSLHVGDLVCSPFTTSCGSCFYCQRGLSCRCVSGQLYGWVENGRGLQGTHAEYVRAPLADSTLVKLPSGLSPGVGLLLGDNLPTGFYCAERAGITKDATYVVLGCGTVGVLTVAAAKLLGADTVLAVDSVAWRRENAMRAGATACCSIEEAFDRVHELTSGRGADGVLEAVGSAAAQLAFELVRPGGTISSIGVPDDGKPFPYSTAEAYGKNITLRSGRCPARAYMDRLLTLLREDEIELDSIITHQLPLSQGAAAYEMFAGRGDGVGKVVLQPGSK